MIGHRGISITSLAIILLSSTSALGEQSSCRAAFDSGNAIFDPPRVIDSFMEPGPISPRKDAILASETILLKHKGFISDKPVSLPEPYNIEFEAGSHLGFWLHAGEVKLCALKWKNGLFGGATGDGHMRWACFRDINADGAYDMGYALFSKNLGLSYQTQDVRLASPIIPNPEDSSDGPDTVGEIGPATIMQIQRRIRIDKVKKKSLRVRVEYGGSWPKKGKEWSKFSFRREARIEIPVKETGVYQLAEFQINLAYDKDTGPQLGISGNPIEWFSLECNNTVLAIQESRVSRSLAFKGW